MRRYLLFLLLAVVAAAVRIAFAVHQPPAHGAEVPLLPAPGTGGTDLVWRTGTMVLRLTEQPCPFDEERDQLEAEGIPPAKRYVVTQAGRKRSGCYVKDMGGDILTLEPGGREVGTVPIDWFRREASERAT